MDAYGWACFSVRVLALLHVGPERRRIFAYARVSLREGAHMCLRLGASQYLRLCVLL